MSTAAFDPSASQQPNALEDLVVQNQATYSRELMAARAQPRDHEASAELKADPDRMKRLAELAEVEANQLMDVAVRGTNVCFVVSDELDERRQPAGAVSSGFFPLEALAESGDKAAKEAREQGAKQPSSTTPLTHHGVPGTVPGGTATVPTIRHSDEDPSEEQQADGNERETGTPPPAGVPANIADLNVKDTVAKLKAPGPGEDARAIAAWEKSRPEADQRSSVIKAADKLGLYAPPAGSPDAPPPGPGGMPDPDA